MGLLTDVQQKYTIAREDNVLHSVACGMLASLSSLLCSVLPQHHSLLWGVLSPLRFAQWPAVPL